MMPPGRWSPRLEPPLKVRYPGTDLIEIATISDLIAFIRDKDRRWRKLREYAFIAAAMPSPVLIAQARMLAETAFREAAILVE
jgi:hypothetical protein